MNPDLGYLREMENLLQQLELSQFVSFNKSINQCIYLEPIHQ